MLTLRLRVILWCLIVNPGIEYLSIQRDLKSKYSLGKCYLMVIKYNIAKFPTHWLYIYMVILCL